MRTRATSMEPSRCVSHSASTRGHMPPRFWGGSLSSPPFSFRATRAGRFIGDNHRRMRQIKECGFATPRTEILSHTPLKPWGKNQAVLWDTKNHRFSLSLSRSHQGPQSGRLAMWNSRQSRRLPLPWLPGDVRAQPSAARLSRILHTALETRGLSLSSRSESP